MPYDHLKRSRFEVLRLGSSEIVQPTDSWAMKKTKHGTFQCLTATGLSRGTHFTFTKVDNVNRGLIEAFLTESLHCRAEDHGDDLDLPSQGLNDIPETCTISADILRVSADGTETLQMVQSARLSELGFKCDIDQYNVLTRTFPPG